MASFASRFNKGKFKVDVKGFPYISMRDCFNNNGIDNIYTIRAIFINTRSKFGTHPVIATDNYLISLPAHLTEDCKTMLKDREIVHMINDGKCGFTIYPYSSHNRECYSVKWVDI